LTKGDHSADFGDCIMVYLAKNPKIVGAHLWMFATIFVVMVSLTSCQRAENSSPEKATQKTFASPEEAGAAFLQAAKSGDQGALLAIFGPDAKDVLFTGDPVKDKLNLEDFVAAYNQMNRWVAIKAGGLVLYTGADNHPFPIPLDKNPSGQLLFDTAAGKDEILARRIGKDELTAIAACQLLVDAQKQYLSQTHDGDKVRQYAQKFASTAGQQDGLYWAVPEGRPPSPLGLLGDFAKAAGTGTDTKLQPFDGYYFRMLTRQGDKAKGGAKDYVVGGKMTGGFAVVAYPTQYRDSGIMIFIVSQDGVVYQKDLGEKTGDVATGMNEYNPGDGWTPTADLSTAGE
jgi:hypothetical protein